MSKLNLPPSPQIYSSSYVPLEKEKATHSRIVAWKIPWTEQPGVHGAAELDTTERLTLLMFPIVMNNTINPST